jgi:hypothetical protein
MTETGVLDDPVKSVEFVGVNSAVILCVPAVPGVHEQVAVQGDADIDTLEQRAVEPSLNVTVPAIEAVAVKVIAVPTVALVALPARATVTEDAAMEVPTLSAEMLV